MGSRALFLFRRDLRIEDNTALLLAGSLHEEVAVAFIFDPLQIEKHPYQSIPGKQFLLESLESLSDEISSHGGELSFFYGLPHDVLREILQADRFEAVYVNRDFTPYSISRDQKLEEVCREKGIPFYSQDDLLLHAPEEVRKNDGGVYSMYTPFMKRSMTIPCRTPTKGTVKFSKAIILGGSKKALCEKILSLSARKQYVVRGGRTEGMKKLSSALQLSRYNEERDLPGKESTSMLSAYSKFGVLSCREIFHAVREAFGEEHALIRELLWRDFFTHIAFHFPRVFQGAFYPQYDALEWSADEEAFSRWCQGTTGFPLVDAGMRQLLATGFMHNRVRLVTASFLVKDLHISWRWGERYFAQMLIDYDPSVNNGNWQWVASTGCDAQPYFRIFNPWIQQKKFDPDCRYIKHWIPELSEARPQDIHALYHRPLRGKSSYPSPIIDHDEEKKVTQLQYARVAKKQSVKE